MKSHYRNLSWVFVCLSLLYCSGTWASVMSESELMEQILIRHPVKTSAEAQVESQQGALLSAKSIYDPKLFGQWNRTPYGVYSNNRYQLKIEQLTPAYGIKLFGGYARSSGPFPMYEGKLVTGLEGELFGGLELPLLRGGWTDEVRTKLAIQEAKTLEIEAQQTKAVTELVREARTKYWDWIFASIKLRLNRGFLKLAKDRDGALERRAQTGDIASIDRKDNLRAIYSRLNRVNIAEQEWVEKTQQLSLYLRDSKGQTRVLELEESPPELSVPQKVLDPIEQIVPRALERSLDLISLEQKINQFQSEESLARNSIFPELNLKLERTHEVGTADARFKAQDEIRVGLYFMVDLPMRKSRGALIDAKNRIQDLEAKKIFLQDKIKAETISLYRKIELLKQNAENARLENELAIAVAAGEQKRFMAGQSNIIAVNLREEAALDAQLKLTETKKDLLISYAELDAILNPNLIKAE